MRPADVLALQRQAGNRAVTQFLANRILQAKPTEDAANDAMQRDSQKASVDQRPNQTGLPDGLKSGIESLSGISLDEVNVHYNLSQPDQLDALAYTQGSEIHVAPGQEEHLPHEAWHIVQQAQGRVQPTMQLKDEVPVNDDLGLEHEADVMGAKALQMRRSDQTGPVSALQRASHVTQLQPKPQFAYQLLQNYANALFKNRPAGGRPVGDGSALAACHWEFHGLPKVNGADHQEKCDQILNGVERLLDKHENPRSPVNLSADDHTKAMDLEDDLNDALEGQYRDAGADPRGGVRI